MATTDQSALRALADPTRIRMGMLMLDAPRTVKELAAALGVPATRLYYHVRILEQHGFIEVASRRLVSGIEERRYRAVTENWSVGPELSSAAIEATGIVGALFDAVKALVEVVMHETPDIPFGEPGSGVAILSLADLILTEDELVQVRDGFGRVFDTYSRERTDAPPGAQRHHFLVAGYRLPGVPGAA